jgi:hypothetical protein
MDQLQRRNALPPLARADLDEMLDAAAARLEEGARDRRLATRLRALAEDLDGNESDASTARQFNGLAATLAGIAGRLR